MNDSRAHYLPYYIVISISVCRREKAAQNGPVFNCMKFLGTNEYQYAYLRVDQRQVYTHNYYNSGTYYGGVTPTGTYTRAYGGSYYLGSDTNYSTYYKYYYYYAHGTYIFDTRNGYTSQLFFAYTWDFFGSTRPSTANYYYTRYYVCYYANIFNPADKQDSFGFAEYVKQCTNIRAYLRYIYYTMSGGNPVMISYDGTLYHTITDYASSAYYRYYISGYTRYYGYYYYYYANYKNYYGTYYTGPFTSNYYIYTRAYLYK